MAITIPSNTINNDTGSSRTSTSLNVPSGATTADIIFVCINLNTALAITRPSGFTSLGFGNASSGRTEIFWKFFQTGDTAYNFTHSSSRSAGVCLLIRSTTKFRANPINVFGSWSTGSGTTHTASSITTTVNDTLHLFCIGRDSNSTTPYASSDFTLIGNGVTGNRIAIGHRIQSSVGATGNYSFTTGLFMATARVMLAISELSIAVDGGTFTLAGQDATLTYTPSGYDLAADSATYTFSGQDAALNYDSGGPSGLLLDTYTGAGVAYSISRKLSSAYTGAAIRVRRLNDNSEQDIGFDGSGNLDESALLSFVGSNDASVVNIYDQSGNFCDIERSAGTSNRVVESGTIYKINDRVAYKNNGDSFRRLSTPMSVSISASGQSYVIASTEFDGSLQQYLYAHSFTSGIALNSGGGVIDFFVFNNSSDYFYVVPTSYDFPAGRNIFEVQFGGTEDYRLNGSQAFDSIDNVTGTFSSANGQILTQFNQELIVWPSVQSSNRSLIYADVDGYYNNVGNDYPITADQAAFTLSGQAVTFKRGYKVSADARTYTLTGQSAGLLYGRKLAADQAAYTLSGQNNTLTRGRKLAADQATYTAAGQSALLKIGRKIAAAVRNFTYSGIAAGLLYGVILPTDAGAFTLTGQNVDFLFGNVLTVESGTFNLTGQQADFDRAEILTVQTGNFTVTGQAAGLLYSRRIIANTGTFNVGGQNNRLLCGRRLRPGLGGFNLAGQIANFRRGVRMASGAGTFTLAGQTANFRRGVRMAVGAGTFTLTGQDAALALVGSLGAVTGYFTLTGQPVNLLRSLIFQLQAGTFTLSGQDAALPFGYQMTASGAVFTFTGRAAGLEINRAISAAVGTYTLSGQPVIIGKTGALNAEPVVFTLTGRAAGLISARQVTAVSGTFTLTGQDAQTKRGYTLQITGAVFTLAGQVTGLIAARRLTAGQATYTLTAFAADFNQDKILAASVGIFTMTGQDAVVRLFRTTAESGSFALTGHAANFSKTNRINAESGSFALAGQPANLIYSNAYFVPRLLWYL